MGIALKVIAGPSMVFSTQSITLRSGAGTGTPGEAPTAANIGALIAGADPKATPIDADSIGISDSAASDILKKLTFANLWVWVVAKLALVVAYALNFTANSLDKGDSGAGTQTFDVSAASVQKITGTGNFTFAFSNIPASGTEWGITIKGVNLGSVSPVYLANIDTAGGSGLTLTASGTDHISVWGDEGSAGAINMAVNLDYK